MVFVFPGMARDDKPVRLRPIDEGTEPSVPVVRLENAETEALARPVRLVPVGEVSGPGPRLLLPSKDEVDLRTHQPGVEVLLDAMDATQENIEEGWEESGAKRNPVPWGWFVLVGLCIASAVLWSLFRVKEGEKETNETRQESLNLLDAEEAEERDALKLVDRIDAVTKAYFDSTSTEELVRHVRHPGRVGPLMSKFYQGRPVFTAQVKAMRGVVPLTLGNRGNFMNVGVVLSNGEKREMIVEIMDSGEPKIDWETLVGYQPMGWTEYVERRPEGESMDFRVVVSSDNFHGYEFGDSSKWACFKLVASGSDEFLFGYVARGGELEGMLNEVIRSNGGKPAPVVLRLSIPVGLQARRGVVIDKVLSARWMFIESPDGGT